MMLHFIPLFFCALFPDSSILWSGSSDRTIRAWDINSSRCAGIINSSSGGHTAAVTCFEQVTAGTDSYIASGGADGELKLWSTSGEFQANFSHGSLITTMKVFQDSLGGLFV